MDRTHRLMRTWSSKIALRADINTAATKAYGNHFSCREWPLAKNLPDSKAPPAGCGVANFAESKVWCDTQAKVMWERSSSGFAGCWFWDGNPSSVDVVRCGSEWKSSWHLTHIMYLFVSLSAGQYSSQSRKDCYCVEVCLLKFDDIASNERKSQNVSCLSRLEYPSIHQRTCETKPKYMPLVKAYCLWFTLIANLIIKGQQEDRHCLSWWLLLTGCSAAQVDCNSELFHER